MKFEIIKVEEQHCQAGDILTLGTPFETTHYLLVDHIHQDSLGAINLNTGTIEYLADSKHGFGSIINVILDDTEWDEWTVISKDRVKMTLDCRNNSSNSKGE